mmetsp:Transcript_963/g.1716  ORF Transcript_963/g.1716 Transcript_963/m.1716 type:complete len:260 (+) Transcript_963:410-1189(+)
MEINRCIKTLEYLILRRIHSLSLENLTQIIQSYLFLVQQGKLMPSEHQMADASLNFHPKVINTGNLSMIKTLESKIEQKWALIDDQTFKQFPILHLNYKLRALNSLLELTLINWRELKDVAKSDDQATPLMNGLNFDKLLLLADDLIHELSELLSKSQGRQGGSLSLGSGSDRLQINQIIQLLFLLECKVQSVLGKPIQKEISLQSLLEAVESSLVGSQDGGEGEASPQTLTLVQPSQLLNLLDIAHSMSLREEDALKS